MKNRKPQFNPNTLELLKSVQDQCDSKRVKSTLRAMSKATDCSLYTSLPGLISNFVQIDTETVNILVVNASEKDIIDHGKWVALLGYLLKNKSLNINLWIIPKKNTQGEVTKGRPVIDYLIDKDYKGVINTHLVAGDIDTVIAEIGLEHINLIINDNPDIDDHNTPESLGALNAIVDKGIPYVIADISPIVLNFKLNIFNAWGFTATDQMEFNKYSLAVRNNISASHRHMGYAYVINAHYSSSQLIDKAEKQHFNQLAASVVSCLNVGEPMKRLPSIIDLHASQESFNLLEWFAINQAKKTLSCRHSGDKVTIQFDSLPECPISKDVHEPTNAQNAELTLWIMTLYQMYLQSYKVRQRAVS